MDYQHAPTKDLLATLIGVRNTRRLYRGVLDPLFNPKEGEATEHQPLLVARELVRRWMAEHLVHVPELSSPRAVADYFRLHYASEEREVFAVMFLTARHRVLAIENLFFGTIDKACVHIREIAKRALELNAAAVILAHNHPSGVAEPTDADRTLTTQVRDALKLFDIRVLDHVVVGETTYSFASHGLL